MNRPYLVAVLALPFLSGVSRAQSPDPRALPSPRIPVHTAEPDGSSSYGIWAGADDYKVSFHDGMTFVPYLGPDYPHNQPWSWRTTSVRVGSQELLPPSDRHSTDPASTGTNTTSAT